MKNKLILLVCVVMLIGLAGACSKKEAPQSSSAEVSRSSGTPINMLMTYPKEKAALYSIMDKFTATKGIQLDVQIIPSQDINKQLTIMISGGEYPDVADINSPDNAAYADMGVLVDISDRVKAELPVDQFYGGAINSCMYDGKYYGLPFTCNNLALFYNVDMFKAAGLAGPPKNWAELKSYAKTLSKEGVYGFANSAVKASTGAFNYYSFLYGAGADINTIDSPKAIESLKFYKSLVDDKSYSLENLSWTQNDVIAQFYSGKAAMAVGGPYNVNVINTNAKFEWNVAVLPEGPAGRITTLGGHNLVILDTPNVENSWQFLKWMNEPENMIDFNQSDNYVPARKDVAESHDYFFKDPVMSIFTESMNFVIPRGPTPKWPDIENEINVMVQSVLTGTKTPEVAAADAGKVIIPLLK